MAKLFSSSNSSSSSSHHHLGHLPLWLLSALRAAKIEGKASGLLKQVRHQVASFVKAKLAAVKGKTSAVKTQLIVFRLLHDRKVLMSAFSDKVHTLVSSQQLPEKQEAGPAAAAAANDVGCKMIAQHNAHRDRQRSHHHAAAEASCCEKICTVAPPAAEANTVLHLNNFDDADEVIVGVGGRGIESVTDVVKKSQREDGQGEFVLEEEIDQVAELFIKRFHRQMMLERLESFRRHQEHFSM